MVDALNLENKAISFDTWSEYKEFGLSVRVMHWITGRNEKNKTTQTQIHNKPIKKIPQPSNQKNPCILQVHTPTLPFNLKAYLSLHLSFDSQNCVNISAKNICQTAQASTSHFKSSGRYVRNCIVLTHLIGFRAQLYIFLSLLQTDRLFSWEEGGSQSNVCQLVHKDAAVSAH